MRATNGTRIDTGTRPGTAPHRHRHRHGTAPHRTGTDGRPASTALSTVGKSGLLRAQHPSSRVRTTPARSCRRTRHNAFSATPLAAEAVGTAGKDRASWLGQRRDGVAKHRDGTACGGAGGLRRGGTA